MILLELIIALSTHHCSSNMRCSIDGVCSSSNGLELEQERDRDNFLSYRSISFKQYKHV